jgi:Tfp pilus assembly protein PilO
MKISKIQQYMIAAAAAILVLIFGYYQFILKPINIEIVSLQSDLADKQKKLDDAKQMLTKYDEFKKRSAAVLRELEWAQSRMPVQLERPKFIESASAIQTRSGISLTSFNFQSSPIPKDSYVEIPADIKFNASFDQLIKFLYEVSVSKSLMIVHDLKVVPFFDKTTGVLNSNQTLTAQMVLSGIQGKK